MDETSYNYTYSNLFTVSNSGSKNNPTQVNYPPPSTQSDPSVTSQAIIISWTFSGIQPTRAELGIMNSQTSAITVIDNNVDLTKQSKNWFVFVETGSYRLYIMDETSHSYTYSNLFTVSNSGSKNNPTQVNYPPPSTQSDPSVTSQGNNIQTL
ncbi:45501_t:CDS:2 [Gigaspora margarita]|uniref:45501_t:CDS:1 n=1 Tax=Gigaspora margarita TaxID=4874 RepID=A0ABN7V3G8_GIGMA|nr:45501_t:CDS:2 [Gigaspora margarita]